MLRYSSGMPTSSHSNGDDLMLIILQRSDVEWRVQWVDSQFCLSASRVGVTYLREIIRAALSPAANGVDSSEVLKGLLDLPSVNDPPFFWVKWPLGFSVTVKFGVGNGFELVIGFSVNLAVSLLEQCEWILSRRRDKDFDAHDLDVRSCRI